MRWAPFSSLVWKNLRGKVRTCLLFFLGDGENGQLLEVSDALVTASPKGRAFPTCLVDIQSTAMVTARGVPYPFYSCFSGPSNL